MRALVVAGVLVLAAACGPKSSKPTADPGPGNGGGSGVSELTCVQVADQLGATIKTKGELGPEDTDFMMEALVASCDRTAWSGDSKACFAAASSATEAEDCQASLTEEQGADFRQAMGMEGGE